MKITITYEEKDLLDYIQQMLAIKGLKPRGMINIIPCEEGTEHRVVVECEDGPLLDKCPMCGNSATGEVVQVKPVQPATKHKRKEVEETEESEPVELDETLGESTEPPDTIVNPALEEEEEEDNADVDEEGKPVPTISSLRGANERLLRERERELASRRGRGSGKHISGESSRPPKGGR